MTPRAAAVKDGRRANPSLDQRLQAILDGGEHGVTLNVVGADRGWRVRARRSEGNLRSVKAKPRSTTLYSVSSLRTRPWCSHAHRRQVPWRRVQSTKAAQRPGWASAHRHLGSSGRRTGTADGRRT